MKRIKKLFQRPELILILLLDKIALLFPDQLFLKYKFQLIMKAKLNLDAVETFNEKIQWLKLYDRKPIYTQMADKYEAKKYVAEIIGDSYIIPTIGIWDHVDDIDFDKLPDQFVLKCTHDSGGIVICEDKSKLDLKAAKRKLKKRLKRNYYYTTREWCYKNIKPRIIAEKLIKNDKKAELLDYKFLVFNGTVKTEFVCSQRYSRDGLKVDFYDNGWNHLPFERKYGNNNDIIPRPYNFTEMKLMAEKIANSINALLLRLDFYEVNKKIYFGEITFYPGGGWESFQPKDWDYKLGEWLELPN